MYVDDIVFESVYLSYVFCCSVCGAADLYVSHPLIVESESVFPCNVMLLLFFFCHNLLLVLWMVVCILYRLVR